MPEKISATFDSKKFRIVLLSAIILIQLICGTYIFMYEKMGYYTDEVWSYSFSDYFGADIFEQDGFMSEYHGKEPVMDYISVQPGEKFGFASVYNNSANDLHPPLYYFILHFICSLFPDKFSPYFAYSVNIVSIAGTQIFLYLTCRLIFREKKYLPFVCCVFYAVCKGAADTQIFLRMYAMLTFITIMHIYYQLRVLRSSDKSDTRTNIILSFVSCYLGFMTDSFFPVVGGTATFFVCVGLAYGKNIKKMFIHGFSMLGALGLYVLTFPSGISHVSSSGSTAHTIGSEYPFYTQIRSMFNFVLRSVTGFTVSIFHTYSGIYLNIILIIVIVLIAAVLFLIRRSAVFVRLKSLLSEIYEKLFKEKKILRIIKYEAFVIAAVVSVYLAISAKIVNIMLMQYFAERYVMNLFPLFCILICMLFYRIADKIKYLSKAAVIIVLCAVIALGANSRKNHSIFLIDGLGRHPDLTEMFRGTKIAFIVIEPWESICFYPYLTECDEFAFYSYEDIEKDPSVIRSYGGNDGEMYFAVPFSYYNIAANSPKGISDDPPNPDIFPSEYDTLVEDFCNDDRIESIEHILDFDAYLQGKSLYRIKFAE